jgi:hypothetical protein
VRAFGAVVVVTMLLVSAACSDDTDSPGPDDAGVTTAAGSPVVLAGDIPVAHTPAGGYGDVMPPPILADCTEPLVAEAPDLRGNWRVVAVEVGGEPTPGHPVNGHLERIEQCGDRIVITAGGVIHDMRCDGTEENGVNDVAASDYTTPITVVATYEDGVHTLRPVGVPDVEITRHLDGGELVWDYVALTARLERLGPPA